MSLKTSFQKIKSFILKRYGNNLAAILVFGSANTGHFRKGKSDIDTMIFLKKLKELNLDKETKFLINELKSENFRTQYFRTLNSIKKYVRERISWSTRITILSKDGSRVLYSTPEFEELKKWLIDTFPSKYNIRKYVQKKDKVELYGYFKKIRDFDLTKALFSHLRRKLQIITYFQTGKIIFDYNKCLNNTKLLDEEKEKLKILYEVYKKRKKLSKKQINKFYLLAKQLTNRILEA